jgi:hypothetical protein
MPEYANAPYFLGLLGLHGKRIGYRRATKKRDEVAPFHDTAQCWRMQYGNIIPAETSGLK